jgi:hypothetical protein
MVKTNLADKNRNFVTIGGIKTGQSEIDLDLVDL